MIIEYAHNKPHEIDRALTDFFGKPPDVPFEDENIEALFLEWLMYEYKQTSGPTFFIEYVLKNPDHLPEKQIHQWVNVLDFWRNLSKKGLPEEFVLNETELLQDIWNYFPHQCLGCISPREAYIKFEKSK